MGANSINGLNLYSYCLNNPISMIDFSGKWPVPNVVPQVGIGVGFFKDLFAGFGGAALGASAKAFASVAKMPMYILDDVGGAVFNPAFLNAMTKATNLQYSGKILSTAGKFAKVASYALLGIDVGLSIYNNFTNPNLSMSRKITDTIVDVGFSVGGFFTAMGAGALFGSIGGPLGTVLGAIAGTIVGVGIWAFQTFAAKIYNNIKIEFNAFVTQTIPNAWNDFVNNWNNFWSFNWAK